MTESTPRQTSSGSAERTVEDLVFLGFNSRVMALDRYTGEVVWDWKSPKGTSSHVAMLLDGDRLIVSVNGYTYCLDPLFGQQVWENTMKGFGFGIPSIVSVRSNSSSGGPASSAAAKAQHQAAAVAAASG